MTLSHRGSTVSWGVWVLLAGLSCWFLYGVRTILTPFVLAAILAYLMNPVVSFFEVRGFRRDVVVFVLFSLLLVMAVGLSYLGLVAVWQDLPDLRGQWPKYRAQANAAVIALQNDLAEQFWILKEDRVLERGVTTVMDWVEDNLWHSGTLFASAVGVTVDILLTPFIAFFFLRGGDWAAQAVLDLCPGRWVERFLSLLNKIDEVLGNYFRGIVFEAFLVGVSTMGGLYFLDLRYAALIGIATGVANMIPYFGPILGGAMGLTVALFQFGSFPVLLKVALVFLVVHYVDSYIFQPLIMNRSVNLNPVAVVFALLCGGQLAGVWGLVFAVPVASLLKEGSRILYDWYRAERGFLTISKDMTLAAAKPWVV